MAANIRIGTISVDAATNAAGIFNGQNMQCDWDSHAPYIGAQAPIMGRRCTQWILYSALHNVSVVGMPIVDGDVKYNGSSTWIRG